MKELIKKSFLLGLGAASITKAKVEKIVKEIAKKGGINTKEGKQMAKRVLTYANRERKRIQKLVQKEANKNTKKMGLISKAEAESMKIRIKALEKRLREEGKKTAKRMLKEVSR